MGREEGRSRETEKDEKGYQQRGPGTPSLINCRFPIPSPSLHDLNVFSHSFKTPFSSHLHPSPTLFVA